MLTDSDLKYMSNTIGKCLTPVLSIVGGILGQEILKARIMNFMTSFAEHTSWKVISRKGKPFKNAVLFDGKWGGAVEVALVPPKNEAPRKRKFIQVETIELDWP